MEAPSNIKTNAKESTQAHHLYMSSFEFSSASEVIICFSCTASEAVHAIWVSIVVDRWYLRHSGWISAKWRKARTLAPWNHTLHWICWWGVSWGIEVWILVSFDFINLLHAKPLSLRGVGCILHSWGFATSKKHVQIWKVDQRAIRKWGQRPWK